MARRAGAAAGRTPELYDFRRPMTLVREHGRAQLARRRPVLALGACALVGAGCYILPIAMLALAGLLFSRPKGPVRLRGACIMLLPVFLGDPARPDGIPILF
mgnify:CR=1 FL=1